MQQEFYMAKAAYDYEMFHQGVDELSQRGVSGLAALQQLFIENLGSLSLYSIDVLFGSMSLALAFQKAGETGWTFKLAMIGATVFSLATSAIQYRLWRVVMKMDNWTSKISLIIPGFLVAIADTGIDSALIEWFLGRNSPRAFPRPMEYTGVMYWLIWTVIVLVRGLNEPLVELFKHRELRKTFTAHAPQPIQQVPAQRYDPAHQSNSNRRKRQSIPVRGQQ